MRSLLSRAALACVLVAAVVVPAPAQSASKRVRIVRSRGTAAPSFVTGISDRVEGAGPVRAALTHLEAHPDRYRIAAPGRTLDLLRVDRDGPNQTVRFAQLHRGIPVWGAQYLVHLRERDEGLEVGAVNGDYFTELEVPTRPAFDRDAAEEIARLRTRPLVIDRVVHHGLTVLPQGRGILTYHLSLWGHEFGRPALKEVFVNALTGSLALAYDGLVDIGPTTGTGVNSHDDTVELRIFEQGETEFELRDLLPVSGEIATHNIQGSSSYFANEDNLVTSRDDSFDNLDLHSRSGAVDAHYGARKFFDFFFERLGRNSIDGNGKSIVSLVNATENGRPLFNAFWDGSQVVYGNPNPDQLHPLSADLDIVGHELTHGVVQFTGKLALISQPGAANEAYADYFGNAIDVEASGTDMNDPEAGFIGEDLCKVEHPSGWTCPLRNLNDGKTAEDYGYYLVDFDNGGVHLNATIYGGALWDIREELGPEKADRYIYEALRDWTAPLSGFFEGREAIVQAVEDDVDATQEEKDADVAVIEEIFDEHRIVPDWDKTVPPSDAETLVRNASPLGLTAFTPPAVSGSRFILGDYEKEEDLCCEPLQIFVGNVSRPVRLQKVGQDRNPETLDDESPDISGRRAVWSHITVERRRLDASVSTRVLGGRVGRVADARGFQWFPSVDGRLIAWEDTRDGDTDIWARRLGRKARKVIDLRGEQLAPQVSGDWIAWWDVGTGLSPRIGMKNFATGRRITLRPPTRFTFMSPPTLAGRNVFWYQDPDGDAPVALMKARIGARRGSPLIRESSRRAPRWLGGSFALIAANKNFVAYTDERAPGGRNLRLISVNGGTSVRVTLNRGDQAYPGLGLGRRVVFLDASQGRTDLVARTVR
ncbi:MAG: M4 family metallopeptidase [Actinomycetota bacterium]